MSALPAHAVRVLHPHNQVGLVRELVALGVDGRDAADSVRRANREVVRFDAVTESLAERIVSAFRDLGGVVHFGPSAYRSAAHPDVVDVVAVGTTGQFVTLANRLADRRHVDKSALGPAIGAPEGRFAELADAITRALASATWGAGVLHLGRFRLDLSRHVAVMGILNVTPDSFHDGGRYFDPARAVERGLAMVEEGADIIDVGGDSASGEAAEIDAAEEIRRVEPVVRALAARVPVPIAVDTHRSQTATAALDAGASLINDITGLSDPEMAVAISRSDAGVCIMHIKGVPKQFPSNWHYRNVIGDVLRFLEARTGRALEAGIAPERICIDPGIEFGKLIGHDLEIFRRLDELNALGFPILVAASRKTLVGNVLGGLPSSERLEGTAAVNTYAISRGARIIRVHDVRAMSRVARMTEALIGMTIDGTAMERCRADGKIVDESELRPDQP